MGISASDSRTGRVQVANVWAIAADFGHPGGRTGPSFYDPGLRYWIEALSSTLKVYTLSYKMFRHMYRVLNID
jgi:hypothetical protein